MCHIFVWWKFYNEVVFSRYLWLCKFDDTLLFYQFEIYQHFQCAGQSCMRCMIYEGQSGNINPQTTESVFLFGNSILFCVVHYKCDIFNTLRPGQNGRCFPDDIFKCIFLKDHVWIPIKMSLKIVPKGPINDIPALVQIMACRRPGAEPLSELMMVSLLTHICFTRPQWVKWMWSNAVDIWSTVDTDGHQ